MNNQQIPGLNKLILLFILLGTFSSCKRMVDAPEGTANIYLTAAINTLYQVPGNPKNYMVDKPNRKLIVPVYIGRSGLQSQSTFTAAIVADDAAAQALITEGFANSNKTIVAPSDLYALPSSVTGGDDNNRFDVEFDANKLNAHLGKFLLLSVRINNPSKFALNEKLSVLNILLDVDAVMLGTKIEVTDLYIKNTGHPFRASSYDGSRRGILADWITSESVKNQGGYGGYDNYGDGGFMSMERYSSPPIPNGKIYQTTQMPAGKYEITIAFLDFSITEQAYLIASPGSSLPDITEVNTAFAYTPFTAPLLSFVVPTDQQVSFGILANLIQDRQYFRIDKFRMFQYQNLFD